MPSSERFWTSLRGAGLRALSAGAFRAATLTGDAARSRRAYQRFLTLWKEADADLPVLIQAKKDYELLK
jgi:hypothetical protein